MHQVVVVGASMVDIIGKSFHKIINFDSNPGHLSISAGGVSRNISENLARLNQNVTLITALGDDQLSQVIINSCLNLSINLKDAYYKTGGISPTYLAILDTDGDLSLALSDTSILDLLPLSHIKSKTPLIEENEVIIMDAALPGEVIEYILKTFSNKKIYVDPVSVGKAVSIKKYLSYFYMLKCNILEAQFLSDIKIENEADFFIAANYFHNLNIKEVVITRGPKGVFYSNIQNQAFYKHRQVNVVNATGAGDAFLAGWVYSDLKNYSLERKVQIASEVAALALESTTTVNPLLNENYIREVIKDGFK